MQKQRFTLVEMLVVMSIIIVLMGMFMAGYNMVMRKAQEQKTKMKIKNLEMAIASYQTQYMVLPFTSTHGTVKDLIIDIDVATGSDPLTGTGSATYNPKHIRMIDLLNTLSGTDASLNPRQIQFLQVDADSTASNPQYRDSWALKDTTGFRIILDLNYDNKIDTGIGYGADGLSKNVVIWSKGRDLQDAQSSGATAGLNADNILSWIQ